MRPGARAIAARGRGRRAGAGRDLPAAAPLGALGDAGCFSFHETKNVTCGEGGALAVRDPELAARAEIIREKGTNRSAFLRGEVDKYTWVAEGSSYVLSDVLAAMLDAQLDKFDEIHRAAARAWPRATARSCRPGRGAHGVRLPAPERPAARRTTTSSSCCSPTRPRATAAWRHLRARRRHGDLPLRAAALVAVRTQPGWDAPRCPSTDRVAAHAAAAAPASPARPTHDVERVVAAVRSVARPDSAWPSPDVSVVLACYNEEETLAESFAEIWKTLEPTSAARYEIIFVDDVSRDRTREIIARHRGATIRTACARILHETNQGRGATVTDGFRAARGEIVGFLDVDLEVHARYIPSLVRAIEEGADVATVRRIYAFQLGSLDRYFMSRGYSLLVRRLLGVPLRDTETGLQVLPARGAAAGAGRDPGPGWFWDTEFMVRAHRRGLRIEEIPGAYVRRDDKTSTVRGLRDSWTYFGKLLAFRRGAAVARR